MIFPAYSLIYDDFTNTPYNNTLWNVTSSSDVSFPAVFSSTWAYTYNGLPNYFGYVSNGNIPSSTHQQIDVSSLSFPYNVTEINISGINLFYVKRSCNGCSSQTTFSFGDIMFINFSNSISISSVSETTILYNTSVHIFKNSNTNRWRFDVNINNTGWVTKFSEIGLTNNSQLSWFMYNSAIDAGTTYMKLYISNITYTTALINYTVPPISYNQSCYQARPDQPNMNSIVSEGNNNFSCNLNYNGNIEILPYGGLRYNFKIPHNTNLSDVVIHYRFGDKENITDYDLGQNNSDYLTVVKTNGTLSILIFNQVYSANCGDDISTSLYQLCNHAYHLFYTGGYREEDTRNFTFPFNSYSFTGTYRTPNVPIESYDNDFFNTFTYYWGSALGELGNNYFMNGFASTTGNSVNYVYACDNDNECLSGTKCLGHVCSVLDDTYNIAKTAFFYDLSVTWYYQNTSNSNITYYNGTCIFTDTFCKNPFYLNTNYYCNDIDIIQPCNYCSIGNIGLNITSDMCNNTVSTCNNTCKFPHEISCASTTEQQTCELDYYGCYKNIYYKTCSSGTFCYSGSCLTEEEITSIHITNLSQINITTDNSNVWGNQNLTNGLPYETKVLILVIVLIIFFCIPFFIGMRLNQTKIGIMSGLIFCILIFILSAIPNFPIFGGVIPFWIVITFILLMLVITVFVFVKILTVE